ncbi:MAG: hypothetical protein IJ460_02270 [Clostridia bacterium]|nr:hypothetical protein [Clostridia bacterium]
MNKNVKTFAAGIITGALIFSLPALARDVYESITVVRNTIGITIDGRSFEEDNFVYNGTTYVPLRAIAETFGKGVEYDEKNNIAKIVTDCSFKYEGEQVGSINGYVITDTMYADYSKHLAAINEYATEEELNAAVKAEIERNIMTMQIANALDIYIDRNYVLNYENMLQFMYMQHGGEEEFKKKMEEQGYTDNLYKHIREVNELKSQIYLSSTFNDFSQEDKDKLFEEILTGLMSEVTITWNN